MKKFDFIKTTDPYVVGNTGARVDTDAFCAHGQAAVFLALFAHRRSQPDQHERLDAFVPRCVLAELIGAVQAQIRHDEGADAARAFRAEADAHAEASYAALAEMHTQARDCCEAGFRTHGTEHTCGRNTEGTRP
ncbi:hypothetical protein ACFXPN_29660 [Streptomyces griseorubiginosus]|uniref:hypothetical protein n=1 Tax=Streptomyces griseorubiginosus TaxID=67304 RepID=UPI0036900333